jgi:hypothetical protein
VSQLVDEVCGVGLLDLLDPPGYHAAELQLRLIGLAAGRNGVAEGPYRRVLRDQDPQDLLLVVDRPDSELLETVELLEQREQSLLPGLEHLLGDLVVGLEEDAEPHRQHRRVFDDGLENVRVREQILPPDLRVRVDVADDRGERAVANRPDRIGLAASDIARQRCVCWDDPVEMD